MCVRRKPCRSITFDFKTQKCELNAKTKENTLTRYGESIVYSEFDWWPEDMDEHCFTRPCQDNEVCIPGIKLTKNGPAESCQYTCMLAGREVCPMPVGGVTAGRSVGDINIFECDHGFTGSDVAECLPNLQWNKTINRVCEVIYNHECSDVEICQPIDAICDNNKCVCNADKQYDVDRRMCLIPPCPNPPVIEGATITGVEGDTIRTYQCEPTFQPKHGISSNGTITCTSGTWSSTDFECFGIRLTQNNVSVSIPEMTVGYLEVFTDGEWTNVCRDDWTWKATVVACRQLGYNFGGSYHSDWYDIDNPNPTAGDNTYKFKDIVCTGDETSLEKCTHDRNSCNDHNKDIVLSCFNINVAAGQYVNISGGDNIFSGQVWVNIGTINQPLCKQGWKSETTEVACKTINPEWSADDKDSTTINSQEPFASEIDCDGTEPHLFFCRNQGWGYNDKSDCPSDSFITITCKLDG
ncbi:scavenger receptor [Mactra antiquata]